MVFDGPTLVPNRDGRVVAGGAGITAGVPCLVIVMKDASARSVAEQL
jgi:hypothetical protein